MKWWTRLSMNWIQRHKLQVITILIILATAASTGISIYMARQSYQDTYRMEESVDGNSGNY